MNAIEVSGLNTYYGKSHILHNVSLAAAEGSITTLLGRNGAGKTTTLRSIMGLTPARTGHVQVFGHDSTRMAPFRVARLGVGYVPEGRRVFANLTVEDNLKVPQGESGPFTIARIYELFPRLEERRMNRGRQLSGGEQEMLSIARALLLNPKVLILDEPSQGLAPLIVRDVFRIVASMKQEGMTVVLVEQVWPSVDMGVLRKELLFAVAWLAPISAAQYAWIVIRRISVPEAPTARPS